MAAPTWDDVRELIVPRDTPCVSIFMPTHRSGRDTEQDPLRLKNLLKQAEVDLRALGLRTPEADAVLAPARDLLGEQPFWRHREDGLALFLRHDWSRVLTLPYTVAEYLAVGRRFHVRPLLPGLWPDLRFSVLALSQRGARLFAASRYSFTEVELPDVPRGMEDVLRYVENEKQLQAHVAARRGPSRAGGAVAFHGHGLGRDVDDERLLEYLRAVDHGVAAAVRDNGAPLVLATLDHVVPLYREVTAVPFVLDEAVTGSPDKVSDEELHRRAWALVEPRAAREVDELLATYRERAARGGTARSLESILRDARQARVQTLFLAEDEVVWGRFDETSAAVKVHDRRRPGDEDLLDRAAVETIATGGLVVCLPRTRMPEESPVAAILRY